MKDTTKRYALPGVTSNNFKTKIQDGFEGAHPGKPDACNCLQQASGASSDEMDDVLNPSHYRRGGIEVKDVIHDWGLGADLAAVCKYLLRYQYKDNPHKDLRKALQYTNFASAILDQQALCMWGRPANISIHPNSVGIAFDLRGPALRALISLHQIAVGLSAVPAVSQLHDCLADAIRDVETQTVGDADA